MKEGLAAQAASFSVPRLEDGRELSELFFKLRLDCPELFYGVGFRYRFYPNGARMDILPEYLFEKGKIKEHQKAMKARVEKLLRPTLGMGLWQKEQYIHDFICQNVHYDKLKKAYSHEIIGPLGQGVGVCEGIAKTVKLLCDALGIWCIIAISDANPDKKIKYRHAWNVVRLEGHYYHLDATFDNTLTAGGEIRYDYFNLDDKRLFQDHEPALYAIPHCGDGNRFYYREKKLSFTRPEEVPGRAAQAVRKGKDLLFHWRGGSLNREVVNQLLEILEKEAIKKGKHARVSLNWPQAVFHVTFQEAAAGKNVVLEEANEGEK